MNRPTIVDSSRDAWLQQLGELVSEVQRWAQELGWATRSIEVPMQDNELGAYQAPALLLQRESQQVLLEPITRSAPGVEGVVDLYQMPRYDDVATLYLMAGAWRLHLPSGESRGASAAELTKDTLAQTLHAIAHDVS